MRISKKRLRKIVRESYRQPINKLIGKNREKEAANLTEASSDIENIGQLKAALKGASQSKRDKQGKEALKDLGKGILADLIPGGGTISSIFDLVKTTYSMDDSKRTGSALDALDVDDHVSAIVDDSVENRFIKTVAEKIEGLADDIPIRNLNMTKMLSQFLEKEFDSRTVAGFNENRVIRVTEARLRGVIRRCLLSEQKISVAGQPMEVELADTPQARTAGLMYRDELPVDSGMLFNFPDATERSFHMKNTKIPLSIAFADDAGTIKTVKDMAPFDETPVSSDCDARYALEVPQGYFDENGIGIGDLIELEARDD